MVGAHSGCGSCMRLGVVGAHTGCGPCMRLGVVGAHTGCGSRMRLGVVGGSILGVVYTPGVHGLHTPVGWGVGG